jgi:glycosyltransferase involved in cell wall biosynthesis
MANLARQSHLFCDRRIEIVPTGVDLSVFKPQNKITVRDQLNISRDRLVIAFGALDLYGDARKGFAKLNSALEHIACSNLAPRCLALIFGRQQLPKERLPITAHFLGHLDSDSALADAYAAADIVVVPSLEDNLPNVALEAIACGVPVVGFNVGGMPEIIRSGWNGALALNKDAESLSVAICEVLNKPERLNEMSNNAVQHARKHFSLIQQGQRFYELYADLHAARKTSIS